MPPAQALPAWARKMALKGSRARSAAFAFNQAAVAAANAQGLQLDFVLYGDSITSALQDKYSAVWFQHFGALRSAPLGVPASTVEELVWRILAGGERLAVPPKARARRRRHGGQAALQALRLGAAVWYPHRPPPALPLAAGGGPAHWHQQ